MISGLAIVSLTSTTFLVGALIDNSILDVFVIRSRLTMVSVQHFESPGVYA